MAEKLDLDWERVNAYVSWNGDSITKSWRFWAEETARGETVNRSHDVKRTGFETMMQILAAGRRVDEVYVEAIDASGRVLAVSDPVKAGPPAPWKVAAAAAAVSYKDQDKIKQKTMIIAEL